MARGTRADISGQKSFGGHELENAPIPKRDVRPSRRWDDEGGRQARVRRGSQPGRRRRAVRVDALLFDARTGFKNTRR